MKDFEQAAEETKKRLGVDLFFICDKKPGACRNFDKWEGCPVCMNDMCHYTSNPCHAYHVCLKHEKCGYYEPDRPLGEFELYKDDDYSGGGYILCTACKYRFSFGAYKILEYDNYCPHCGAKIIRRPDPNTLTFTFNIYKKDEGKT